MNRRFTFLMIILFGWTSSLAQVNASFTANQTSGCPNPLFISLTSTSTAPGGIDSYDWEITGPAPFVAETSVTNQLTTTLTIPGFYNVTLIVCSGAECDTLTEIAYIEVFALPTISMSISPLLGCAGVEVCFDGTFNPGCGTIASSLIDTKDGTIYSDMEDVCHVYDNLGTFTDFTVSVTNSCGCSTTANVSDTLEVSASPTASFTANQTFSCTPPLNVNFTNTSTDVEVGSTYEWNIPGVVSGANTENLSQSFPVGSYDVELIVINPNGCSDTVLIPNYIVVGDPDANFTSNVTSICANQGVMFTDISSGSPNSWSWTFEGNGTSNVQNPNHLFTNPGTWDVTLQTSYPGGCTDQITITDYITVLAPPINNFSVTESSSCALPFTTSFSNTSTNANSTTFTFTGGTPNTYTGNGPVNITYNAHGQYGIQMTSTAANGCSTSNTFSNVIELTELSASIMVDSAGPCVPVMHNFSYAVAPAEPIADQSWDFPGSDILTSSDSDPVVGYATGGCYDATLIVNTISGCSDTVNASEIVCVGEPPTGSFTVTPNVICFEEEEVCAQYVGTSADSILWDFGDPAPPVWGNADSAVCYPYSEELGDFTVTMMLFDNGCPGDTVAYLDTVHVVGPIAAFSDSILNCVDWNTIRFTDESVESDSVYYTFGDPTSILDTSTSPNPTWTYPADDTIRVYTVTQFAYNDSTGCEHEVSNDILVYPPHADFTFNNPVDCAPASSFFANTSFFPGPGANTNWNWVETFQFSGGGQNVIWSNNSSVSRNFTLPGLYTITMRNTDPRGCMDTVVYADTLIRHGIDIGFTQDSTEGCVPLTVNFNDTSTAPLSFITYRKWDFGVPGTLADTSNAVSPSYNYTEAGVYTVTLTLMDSAGCDRSLTSLVTVNGPVVNISLSDTFICNNQTISITNMSTGNNLSYDWQFSNAIPPTDNTASPPILTYNTEGIETVYLEISDGNCTDDTTVNVHVFDVVAQASANMDTINCFSSVAPVVFTNESFNNVDSSSVWWDLGNGATSTLFNPSTIYNVAGSYEVSMSLASQTGCRDTVIVDTIFVGGPYARIEALDNVANCFCETMDFEITTWNASNPIFIPGDGGSIPYIPNGILGDTIIDTIQYQYCLLGEYVPEVFIDDGTCSGNVALNDTVRIDSLVVNFSVNSFSFCDSGTICFTDSSFNAVSGLNNMSSWLWDFGDGDTSSLQSPCHNYSSPGTFTVKLIVESDFSCIDSLEMEVFIPESPMASFAVSDTIPCANDLISFWDSSSAASNSMIDSWYWDFGITTISSDTSILQNPTYTYMDSGLYQVTLLIIDTFGCSTIDSLEIDVWPIPDIDAGNDANVCAGDSIQLQGSGGVSYIWSPNYQISDVNIPNPLVYPLMDTFYVVTGLSPNGCSNLDTVLVDVNDILANFSTDTVCDGFPTNFSDLSLSDGTVTSWSWNFDDPPSGLNNTSILQNPSHLYVTANTYNVSLSVGDDNSCSADTVLPVLVSPAPLASFIGDSVCVGLSNSFNSSSSHGGSGSISSYHWDFGVAGVTTDTSNLPNPSFSYPNTGLYTVCLSITSDAQCSNNSADTCMIVQVYDLPNAAFTFDNSCLGNQNNFTDNSLASSDAGIATTFWNFGQNAEDTILVNSSPANTQFVYDLAGQYTVVLTVTDSNSCSNTSFEMVQVFDVPSVDFDFVTICQNQNNDVYSIPTGGAGLLSYYWDFDEGAGFVSGDSLENYSFAIIGLHDVMHAVVDENGCTDTISKQVNVNVQPTAIVTGDSTICEGISTNLSGSSSIVNALPPVYDWSVSATQTSNITYLPNGDESISLTVTDANGCIDSTSVFIDVLTNPNANFDWTSACEDLPITVNSTTTVGDAPIISYSWDVNSPISGNQMFIGPNFVNTWNTLDTLDVELIVTDANGCEDAISQTIIVDEQPVIDVLIPSYILCPGSVVTLDLNDSTQFTTSGVGTVDWSPIIGVDNPSSSVVNLTPTLPITYNVSASSSLGQCPEDDVNEIFINVATLPTVILEAVPNPVLLGSSSAITAQVFPFNSNTDTLSWDNSSGTLDFDFGFNVQAAPIVETNYPLELTYAFEDTFCTLDTSITIFILSECNGELIYAPNIFTPNNDGNNDIFRLSGYGISVVNYLRVFDRWGQVMYDGNGVEMTNGKMNDGWRGTNKGGRNCNSGVYVYSYEIVCANGDIIKGSGNVTLIK